MVGTLFKDALKYGASDIVLRFLAFATFPLYANLFDVSDFGIIALVGTFTTIISIVSRIGLSSAVQRYYFDEETPKDERKTLISSGLTALVIWSIIIIGLFLLAFTGFKDFIKSEFDLEYQFLFLATLSTFPSSLIKYSMDVIRLNFKPWTFMILSFSLNLSGVLLGLFLVIYLDFGLYGIFLGGLLGPLFFSFISIWSIKKYIGRTIKLSWIRKLVRYGFPFIFAEIAYWLYSSMDRWMLSSMLDNTEVGLYSIGFKLSSILLFVVSAFGQAWPPMVFKWLGEEKPEIFQSSVVKVFNIFFATISFVGTLICLFSYEVLLITTPEEYWSAVNLVIILTMAIVVNGSIQFTVLGISIQKRPEFISYVSWVSVLVNFLANFLLIPKYGAVGASSATLVTNIFLSISYFVISQRFYSFPWNFKFISSIVLINIIVAIVMFVVNQLEWSYFIFIIKLIASLVLLLGLLVFVLGIKKPKDLIDIIKTKE